MDAIFQALSGPLDGLAPSGCPSDICSTHVYAASQVTGDLEKFSTPMSVGQGAHAAGDGGTVFVPALSNSRFVSVELEEARFPIRYEKAEFVPDSGGAGRFQGGLGWERQFRVLKDAHVTALLERTRNPSWGQAGGHPGITNRLTIASPDGSEQEYGKKTRFPIQAGSRLRVRAGGGGGYGRPEERAPEAVRADLENEYITRSFAERYYAHAIK
jgi:N-methylhydantoinase B